MVQQKIVIGILRLSLLLYGTLESKVWTLFAQHDYGFLPFFRETTSFWVKLGSICLGWGYCITRHHYFDVRMARVSEII